MVCFAVMHTPPMLVLLLFFLLIALHYILVSLSEQEYLSYAFGMVSDYITFDLCEKLSTHLGLEKVKAAAPGKRKSLIELENNTLKRVKSEEDFSAANIDTMPPSKPLATVQEKKTSTKEKQLAKAASGTKSISSFFMKK